MIRNIIKRLLGRKKAPNSAQSRADGAGGAVNPYPPIDPRRPHYQQIADAEFFDRIEREAIGRRMTK